MTRSLAILVLLAAAFAPAQAFAVVTVMGGGLGQTCYELARALSEGRPPRMSVDLPGGYMGLSPLQACTLAIEGRSLTGRDLAGTFNNRGVIHYANHEYAQAEADFRAALAVESDIAELHVNHGVALVALERWQDLLAPLTQGIAMDPAQPEKAYYSRAIANDELGKMREAYDDYRKALALKPDWKAPALQLTRFQVKQVEVDEAD